MSEPKIDVAWNRRVPQEAPAAEAEREVVCGQCGRLCKYAPSRGTDAGEGRAWFDPSDRRWRFSQEPIDMMAQHGEPATLLVHRAVPERDTPEEKP